MKLIISLLAILMMSSAAHAAVNFDRPGNHHRHPRFGELCVGYYSGQFSNGVPGSFEMRYTGGDNDDVYAEVKINPTWLFKGNGYCRQYSPNEAEFVVSLSLGDGQINVHRGTISEGRDGLIYLQGSNDAGLSFNFVRR